MKKTEYTNLVNMAAKMMRTAAKYESQTVDMNEVGAQSLAKACWYMEQAALLLVQAAANEKTDC